MDTKERTQDQISALADGELTDNQIEPVLAALRNAGHRADWDIYHQIGDVLRSDDMAFSLSENFAARMAARLEAEPSIVAPSVARAPQMPQQIGAAVNAAPAGLLRRFAMPGMAAAAVATAVFVTAPHMLVAEKEVTTTPGAAIVMVANPAPTSAVILAPALPEVDAESEAKLVTLNQQDGEVLRDPRIDEYLMAHQRFSPSVFSTAQYARSATFATDSGK